MRSHFLLLSKKTIITCGDLPAQCGIEVPGVQMLLAMKININPLTYSLEVCEWWGQCRANSCKFLPSISHPWKRQIVLYSPCPLVGRLLGVTIDFPSPNAFLHFLLGFSSSPEQNNNKNNNNNNDDHPYGPASCKRSSGWTGLFQKIIWRDRSLANDQNSNMRFALLTWTSFLLFVHIMIISHLPSYRKHFLGDKAPYI